MSDHTYKKIEIVGTSSESISEAIKNGIDKASSSVRHMSWFEVAEIRGYIDEHHDNDATFQVTLKIGFRLDE